MVTRLAAEVPDDGVSTGFIVIPVCFHYRLVGLTKNWRDLSHLWKELLGDKDMA